MLLHQRRWRKLGYPGLFADARFRAFQESVARAFFRNGWLRVTRADSGGACVAVRLSYAHNGRLYDYLSGFDDDAPAAKRRPGLALLFAQMEAAFAEGIRTIDLLRGEEPYKFELTAEAPRNMNMVATLPHAARGTVLRRAGERTALVRFLAAREARLFGVALAEHAFPASLYHYARFRTGRFFLKFFGPRANEPRRASGTA
jgi:CelD/BcsL family acetyltransferase involved in cellulose biosynthesis